MFGFGVAGSRSEGKPTPKRPRARTGREQARHDYRRRKLKEQLDEIKREDKYSQGIDWDDVRWDTAMEVAEVMARQQIERYGVLRRQRKVVTSLKHIIGG